MQQPNQNAALSYNQGLQNAMKKEEASLAPTPLEAPKYDMATEPLPEPSYSAPMEVIAKIRAREKAYNETYAVQDKKIMINPYPTLNSPAPARKPGAKPTPAPVQLDTINVSEQSLQPVNIKTKTIDGFGSDVPLVLALHQIVPAKYAYSFSENVDIATTLSWDGMGNNWDYVLAKALSEKGMSAYVTGNTLVITKGKSASAAPQAIDPSAEKQNPEQRASGMDVQYDWKESASSQNTASTPQSNTRVVRSGPTPLLPLPVSQ
jgi:hypothetical protein